MAFCLAIVANSYTHQITVSEVYFHTESIGANPVKITHKMMKLFEFFEGQTQRKRTIPITSVWYMRTIRVSSGGKKVFSKGVMTCSILCTAHTIASVSHLGSLYGFYQQ